MNRTMVIAKNSFQEMVRERFFLVILFGAVALLSMSLLLGALSFAEQKRILADLGLAAIELSILFMALFQGAYIIQKEIEKQTCLVLLAKPISRTEFLIGKWLGVVFLISVTQLALGSVLFLLLTDFTMTPVDFSQAQYLYVSLCIWLKVVVLLSVVFLFGIMVRPLFALLFGFSLYLLGHWLNDLKYFAEKSKDEGLIFLSQVIHEIVPQFYRFNWKSYYFLQQSFDLNQVLIMVGYLLTWIVLFLVLSSAYFKGKDIA